MLVEGVGSVARRTTVIERILKPLRSEEECPEKLCPEESGIRIEEQPAPAIEESIEVGDDIPVTPIKDPEGASISNT
jgi:hypothetical protein